MTLFQMKSTTIASAFYCFQTGILRHYYKLKLKLVHLSTTIMDIWPWKSNWQVFLFQCGEEKRSSKLVGVLFFIQNTDKPFFHVLPQYYLLLLLATCLDISRYDIDNRYDQVWVDALSGPDEEYEHEPLLPGPHQEQEAEHPHVPICR